MSASPWPHLDAQDAPLGSVWQTPADSFRALAERTRQNPEAATLGNSVGNALAEYLDGAITLRDLARRHTPFERFRAVRVWGPDDERFKAIMPVLDDLIALHRSGKTPQRPEYVGKQDWPTVTRAGRYACTQCDREIWLSEGAPQLCPQHRRGLGATGTAED